MADQGVEDRRIQVAAANIVQRLASVEIHQPGRAGAGGTGRERCLFLLEPTLVRRTDRIDEHRQRLAEARAVRHALLGTGCYRGHALLDELGRNIQHVREHLVHRNGITAVLTPLHSQHFSPLKCHLWQSDAFSPLRQIDELRRALTVRDQAAILRRESAQLHLIRYCGRIDGQFSDVVPVHGHLQPG